MIVIDYAFKNNVQFQIPKDLRFGHPKFDKLKEIMLEHFTAAKRKGQDTRAIGVIYVFINTSN